MSEQLSPLQNLKFKNSVQAGQHSPFLKKSFSENPKLTLSLHFTSAFMKEVEKTKNEFPDYTYVDIINSQICAYQLVNCERLEKRFFALCKKVILDYRTKFRSGAKRRTYDENVFKVAVFDDELIGVRDLNFRLARFEREHLELEKKCQEILDLLNEEIVKSEKLKEQNIKSENTIENLNGKNNDLLNYLKTLESRQTASCKTHKDFDSIPSAIKYRTIRELQTKSERALWFAQSFELLPVCVKFKSKTGNLVDIDLSGSKSNTKFQNLDADDKQKLRDIVFILDKFGISDAAYHEFTFFCQDLPKKYLVCQSRSELNNIFHIERTPGNVPGAFISLKNDLEMLFSNQRKSIPKYLKIKISGDGTKVSRISNFLVISYTVIEDDNSSVSVDKQRVLGIISCSEDYDMIQKTCNPLFKEINEMYALHSLTLYDEKVELDLILGGDMKFLQIVLGLGGSTGNYACPWCKVHKDDRPNLQKPWDFYHSTDMFRTIHDLQQNSLSKSFGSKSKPLIEIEPRDIIPDELHLLLRISDILLRNLIDDVKSVDDINKTNGETTRNLDELVKKIRECGVSFNIWTQKGSKGELDWSSLTGADYKLLFQKLPEKLFFLVHHETHENTVKLWTDFFTLYRYICHDVHTFSDTGKLFEKCKAWGDLFLSLGSSRRGYSSLTPYMHVFIFHIPWFVKSFGSLSKYSGQGIEKVNDKIKLIHQKKTNKIDSAVDALRVRKRIEFLQDENCEREKRVYEKRKQTYWEEDIFRDRSKKKANVLSEISSANVTTGDTATNYDLLSDTEIRDMLLKKNIKTRLKKREKLLALLNSLSSLS